MPIDPPAQEWIEKVVDGTLRQNRIPVATARGSLMQSMLLIAEGIAKAKKQTVVTLDHMFRAFHEAGGFDGLLELLFRPLSPNNQGGANP